MILSLDLSLSSTGYSIFNDGLELIGYGKINPSDKKVEYILNRISNIIAIEKVDKVLLEGGFVGSKNMLSSLKLAELRGAVKYLCMVKEIDFVEYAPQHIKKSVTGKGNASKEEVFERLSLMYKSSQTFNSIGAFCDKNSKNKTSDIYDSIAIFQTYKNELE